jgi:TonB-linked SusC/RagA family outer membrane protein
MKNRFVKQWLLTTLVTSAFLWPASVAAQTTGQVVGVVTAETGQPLSGASVSVVGTSVGALSGNDGRFTLTSVPTGQQTVRASLIGFGQVTNSVQVTAGEAATVNFQLASQAVELEGVVAVGYGTQQRVNLTGAVASINTTQMERLPVPTVTHALQGLSPGLQILDGGHLPGRWQTDILVRGQGSLGRGNNRGDAGASRPLVLIDGIEGDMATLDINDVENISVLKDASSAAIYGSRAANGVILINTKRGVASARPQISYSGYVGIQEPTAWPETVGAPTHMELRNVARSNMRNWCTTTGECNPSDFEDSYTQQQIEMTRRGELPNTNWFDAQFGSAPIQDHTLRVTGGTENARYSLGLDHMREDGMMATTGAKRTGVRLNTDFRASDRITGGLDLAATQRWDIIPGNTGGSIFYLIHDTPPTRAVRTEDGMWGLNLFGFNPVAYANETGDEQRTFNQGTVTGRLNYDLIPGWAEIQTLGSVLYENEDWERFFTDSRLIEDWPTAGARWGPNRLENRDIKDLQTTLRALLDFGHTFQDGTHDWSGVLGYEQIESERDDFRAWRQDFYNNDLRRLNVGNADTRGNFGAGSQWALRSVFGRMNYVFRERYLFEANARYDGSSRFAEGRRFGLFPSFSAGWRISEEPFFNVGFVDELKLRGSWGRLGNQEVPLYSYYSSVSITEPYWFGNQVNDGSAITGVANDELSWETTTVTDVGFDAAFMQGRLSLTGDIYNRKTEDILLAVPIPAMVGRSAPFINAGVVENKGWELSVGWRDAIRAVNYGIDFNLSDNRNKVLDLYNTGPYISGETVVAVGQPIRSWYGFEVDGYFRDQAEIDQHAELSGWITRPGDLKYVDQNGDGVINEDDRTVMGDPNPRYTFGMNLSASWRNFDAGAFFQGVGKRDQYLALGFIQGPVWENFTSEWHKDYYDPALDNQDARHPSYYSNYNRNYYAPNEHWVLDGSFVKLRNVQLGYNLPTNFVLDRLGVQRMRINVTGKNLWMHQNLGIDLDPEYPFVRADYYPQTRTFSIGTDLSF